MSDADGLTPLLWYTHKKIHNEAELTPSDLGNVSVSLFINIMWRHNTHATHEAKIGNKKLGNRRTGRTMEYPFVYVAFNNILT